MPYGPVGKLILVTTHLRACGSSDMWLAYPKSNKNQSKYLKVISLHRSVADSHHFDAYSSDPVFHCNMDLDPASQNDADPGPRHCFTGFLRQERRVAKGGSLKVYYLCPCSPCLGSGSRFLPIPDSGSRSQKGTGPRIPDPDTHHFYAVRIPFSKVTRIRIQLSEMMRIHADPDPQRCFTGFLS